jgi:hypothetical protein
MKRKLESLKKMGSSLMTRRLLLMLPMKSQATITQTLNKSEKQYQDMKPPHLLKFTLGEPLTHLFIKPDKRKALKKLKTQSII